jgi:hypothetical protein
MLIVPYHGKQDTVSCFKWKEVGSERYLLSLTYANSKALMAIVKERLWNTFGIVMIVVIILRVQNVDKSTVYQCARMSEQSEEPIPH